ncbi:hypothetical protein RHSIM_Rhsim08G0048200 [Rhododendron simsii]|uniref:Surfeit locus protein 2 n=1 Tax=Rhododendron simsii TaxID=118357 RepID=A0A834GJM4_RHOSS|nr:hypothetical protein RHSIM_Rhsim08G0048200 [Rhododendron simsii]
MAKEGGEEAAAAADGSGKEGKNLLGKPKFKKMENGRFRCVETGHEVPAHAKDSYAQSKHCRIGLIDAALARSKPPLNMFHQDPQSRSKLICKLTGLTVNKSEEHIWKHMNGKRFLNMLEKMEAEEQTPNGIVAEQVEQPPDEKSNTKADFLKKKNKKKKKETKEVDVNKVISEVRNPSDMDSDSEEADFWMPEAGDRWDFDDGGDRWGSGSESEPETEDANGAETEDANGADDAIEEGEHSAKELSKRTKRMSIEIGPSDCASRKKKKKTQPTS